MPTNKHSDAKPDTVLLLDFSGTDTTDYSQYRTHLTDNTTYLSEATSARVAFDPTVAGREIYVGVNMSTGQEGTLIALGDAVAQSWAITVESDAVVCYEAGVAVVTATVPGLTASDRSIRIGWHQHPDGDDVRSELIVWNSTVSNITVAAATHTPSSPDSSHTLTVGAAFGGGDPFDGGLDFQHVRIGRRYHSGAEFREDWIAVTTPPSMTQTRRGTPLVPDRSTIPLADEGYFTGPAHLWAGHVFEECDRRLVGPLVNFRAIEPLQIEHTFDMPTTAWWRDAPDGSGLKVCLAHLWRRPVPGKVNRAHVRARVRMNNSSAATVATATLRAYSMSGLPVVSQPAAPLIWHRTAVGTRATDDGTTETLGAWIDLGELPLAVDDQGRTWLALGVAFDEEDGEVANTELYVLAVTMDPYFEPAEDGGFDIEEP